MSCLYLGIFLLCVPVEKLCFFFWSGTSDLSRTWQKGNMWSLLDHRIMLLVEYLRDNAWVIFCSLMNNDVLCTKPQRLIFWNYALTYLLEHNEFFVKRVLVSQSGSWEVWWGFRYFRLDEAVLSQKAPVYALETMRSAIKSVNQYE